MKQTMPTRQTTTKQSLAVSQPKQEDISVSYKDSTGNPIELSLYVLNNYLAPGENFTAAEAWTYFQLCKARNYNPMLRDCYLVRYQGKPTVIASRDLYNKRANAYSEYDGKQSGVVVLTADKEMINRKGTLVLDDETLIGAWCDVYIKSRKYPESVVVNFKEVARYKSGGELMSTWATQPAWMAVKVAEARCLKAAIPEEFNGTYAAEEVGFEETNSIPIVNDEVSTTSQNMAKDAVETEFDDVDEETVTDSFFDEED